MNLFKKAFKYFIASQILLSSFFVFNFYAVYNDKLSDKSVCYAFFKSNKIELCYDFKLGGMDYCPIDSTLSGTDNNNE